MGQMRRYAPYGISSGTVLYNLIGVFSKKDSLKNETVKKLCK